jgi:hypothetical protein
MSFYVTLPSNSSMNFNSNNVQSHYTINLPNRLYLNKNYEVGLAEISYNQSVNVSLGVMLVELNIEDLIKNDKKNGISIIYLTKLKLTNPNMLIKVELFNEDCVTLENAILNFNTQIEINFNKTFDLVIKPLIIQPESDIDNWKHYLTEFKNLIMPEFNIISNKCQVTNKANVKLNFLNQLAELLKKDQIDFSSTILKTILETDIQNIYRIHDTYNIFLNIIQEQYYGDVKAKIIRNIVPQGQHGEKINLVYNTIHYTELSQSEFQSITIQIKDTTDQFIRFTNKLSKVTIKLHFKLKNE